MAKNEVMAAPKFDMNEFQEEVNPNDIQIPRILAMQGLSPQVMDGKAKFGDFLDTHSENVIGGLDKPVDFIPLTHYSVWHEFIGDDLKGVVPVTPENQNLPWNDGEIRRSMVRNFYVLLPGNSIPHIVGFKGTSARAGKALITQMNIINKTANLPPFGKVMTLHGKKESNDKGTFIVLNVKTKRAANNKELNDAYKWYKIIKSGETKPAPVAEEMPF